MRWFQDLLWAWKLDILVVIVVLFILGRLIRPKILKLKGSHVLITGGSSGIGKSLAVEAAKLGASVTLLARNQARLAEARAEVEKHFVTGSNQKVMCVSADITNNLSALEETVKQIEESQGPISALINCAGTSMSGKFLETPMEEFRRMMDINFHGSVLLTRAVVPSLIQQKRGRVVFVSSMAGQLGLFGYTAYSSSKFALRGLAESLQMELRPHNIQVTLAFPPDTDTPGYAEEEKTKPKETRLLSQSGGLFQPDVVACSILADMEKGRFMSSVGLDGFILSTLTSGFSSVNSLREIFQQVMLMGVFRLVSLFYVAHFSRIVKKCHAEQTESTQPQPDDSKKAS